MSLEIFTTESFLTKIVDKNSTLVKSVIVTSDVVETVFHESPIVDLVSMISLIELEIV